MPAGINVTFDGKMRCKATLEERGQTVTTDVGKGLGGLGEYLSPVDMTVASLGACAMSMIAVVAEHNHFDVSKVQTATTYEMHDSPTHKRIGSVHLTVTVPGDVPPEVRTRFEAAVKACPVKNSLHPDIVFDMKFVYG